MTAAGGLPALSNTPRDLNPLSPRQQVPASTTPRSVETRSRLRGCDSHAAVARGPRTQSAGSWAVGPRALGAGRLPPARGRSRLESQEHGKAGGLLERELCPALCHTAHSSAIAPLHTNTHTHTHTRRKGPRPRTGPPENAALKCARLVLCRARVSQDGLQGSRRSCPASAPGEEHN